MTELRTAAMRRRVQPCQELLNCLRPNQVCLRGSCHQERCSLHHLLLTRAILLKIPVSCAPKVFQADRRRQESRVYLRITNSHRQASVRHQAFSRVRLQLLPQRPLRKTSKRRPWPRRPISQEHQSQTINHPLAHRLRNRAINSLRMLKGHSQAINSLHMLKGRSPAINRPRLPKGHRRVINHQHRLPNRRIQAIKSLRLLRPNHSFIRFLPPPRPYNNQLMPRPRQASHRLRPSYRPQASRRRPPVQHRNPSTNRKPQCQVITRLPLAVSAPLATRPPPPR
jgi:hypothetical protein